MQAVQTPIIPVVADLIRRHPGTISLGQGVVYYGPPPQAEAKIAEFFKTPEIHKYKPVHGITQFFGERAHQFRNAVHRFVFMNFGRLKEFCDLRFGLRRRSV
ncbi:MAG TPA: hypothetical protein VI282_14155, partial [Verrucomicrobiae bacterium]